jgi:hypothetical protein
VFEQVRPILPMSFLSSRKLPGVIPTGVMNQLASMHESVRVPSMPPLPTIAQ